MLFKIIIIIKQTFNYEQLLFILFYLRNNCESSVNNLSHVNFLGGAGETEN